MRRVVESRRFATQWEFKSWAEPGAADDGAAHGPSVYNVTRRSRI